MEFAAFQTQPQIAIEITIFTMCGYVSELENTCTGDAGTGIGKTVGETVGAWLQCLFPRLHFRLLFSGNAAENAIHEGIQLHRRDG